MPVTEQQREKATQVLINYRERCYRLYFAFGALGAERQRQRQSFEASFAVNPEVRDASVDIGRVTNGDPNNIQLETVASIRQGDLVDALHQDGEFDNLNNQAFVVFIFQLWDEHYKGEIAKGMGLGGKDKGYCDLLGDLRHIRHSIIHNQAVLNPSHLKELRVLPRIWSLQPGNLSLTGEMMTDLLAEFGTLGIGW